MTIPYVKLFFTKILEEFNSLEKYTHGSGNDFFERNYYKSEDLTTLYSFFAFSICLKSFRLSDNKYRPKAGSKVLKYLFSEDKKDKFTIMQNKIISNSILLSLYDSCVFNNGIDGLTIGEEHTNHLKDLCERPFKNPFINLTDMKNVGLAAACFYRHIGVPFENDEFDNLIDTFNNCFAILEKVINEQTCTRDIHFIIQNELVHSYDTEKYDVKKMLIEIMTVVAKNEHVFSNPNNSHTQRCTDIFFKQYEKLL